MADNDDFIEIEMPDGAVLEFPSSMSQDDINQAAQKYHQQSPIEQKKPKPEQSLQQKIARYGIQNPLVGAGKMARNMAGLYQNIPIVKKLTSDEQMSKAMGLPPPSEQGAGDIASQAIPDIAGAMLTPGAQLPNYMTKLLSKAPGIAGKVMPKVASEGISQGLYGSAVSPPGQKTEGGSMSAAMSAPFAGLSKAAEVTPSAVTRQALSTGIGGASGLLGYEMGQGMGLDPKSSALMGTLLGLGGYRGSATPKTKMRQQIKDVDLNDPKVQQRLQAAEELGVNITPAQATKKPSVGEEHAELGRSKRGTNKYFEKAEKRLQQEESAIKSLLDTIYDPSEMNDKVRQGYANSYPEKVPFDVPAQFLQNNTIKRLDKIIKNDPELMESLFKSGATPQTSVGYWDIVKRMLDQDIKRYSLPDAKSADKAKVPALEELRENLVKRLENVSPAYDEAKSLSRRKIAREKIDKVFDKKEMDTGHTLYKAILNNEPKFEEVIKMLEDVPEAQQMLRNMKLIFDESRTIPKVMHAEGKKAMGMKDFRNTFKNLTNKLFNDGKFDEQTLDFIHSGKWHKEMEEINKISDTQLKMSKFLNLLSKATGTTGRQATTEEQ